MTRRTLSVPVGTSPRDLCNAFRQAAANHGHSHLIVRPWNPHDPAHTPWWLVPSTDLPAYRFGKHFFRWHAEPEQTIFAGLQIEKGASESLAAAFMSPKGKRFVMDGTWEWHQFAKDIRSGAFAKSLTTAATNVDCATIVRVTVGIANDPEAFDPHAPTLPRATTSFDWVPEGQTLRRTESKGELHLAPLVPAATSLSAVMDALEGSPDFPWLWVNIYAGLVFTPTPNVRPLVVDAMWSEFFEVMNSWVR